MALHCFLSLFSRVLQELCQTHWITYCWTLSKQSAAVLTFFGKTQRGKHQDTRYSVIPAKS